MRRFKYKGLTVGEMAANCYLLWVTDSRRAVVIDPGDEGWEIAEEIQRLGLMPEAILATHGHFDHVMAAVDLKLIFSIPFFCSSRDKFLLQRQERTAEFFLKRTIALPEIIIDTDLDKAEIVKTAGMELSV